MKAKRPPPAFAFETEDDFKMARALYDSVVKLGARSGDRRRLVNAVITSTTRFAEATEISSPAKRRRKLEAARAALVRAASLLAQLEARVATPEYVHARRIADALLMSGPRIRRRRESEN